MTSNGVGGESTGGKQPAGKRWVTIDLIFIGLIGLVVQGFWTWQVREPTYMDAYYYTTNGARLADGYGFNEEIIWQYLDDPQGIPTPSHTYWMPFTSILASAGYTFRDSFRAAQIPFWLLSSLLPLLSFGIVWILKGERWQAWAAALFTAAGGYYGAFMAQPTTFAPFAWAGASCLLFIGLSLSTTGSPNNGNSKRSLNFLRKQKLYLFLIGVTAGIAHLTRADGLLFFLIGILFWVLYAYRINKILGHSQANNDSEGGVQKTNFLKGRLFWEGLLIIIAGYLLIMGFWLVRNWQVTGSPLPRGGAQSLFLTTYDDIYAYERSIDLRSYLNWGLDNILKSKLQALSIGIQTYIAVLGSIFLAPFVIIGLVNSLRDQQRKIFIWPVFVYLSALFIIMTLIFTFPGMRGSLFHSSVAAWPWSTALAALGVGIAVDWAAKRLPHWQPAKAKPRFTALFVVIAFIVGIAISWPRSSSNENGEILREIGEQMPGDSLVFAGNAPALYYYTYLAALSVPNEPADKIVRAAEKYGGTYLILDENHPLPLVDLYHGTEINPDIQLIGSYDSIKLYRIEVPGS